jgi:hypothetical protein
MGGGPAAGGAEKMMRSKLQEPFRRLLALCARDAAHEAMLVKLEQALAECRQQADAEAWHLLLHEAEAQGMAPLLHKHLSAVGWSGVPEQFRRPLQSLRLRNRHASGIRSRAAGEIAAACAEAGIDLLLVKGIALACSAYSEPDLRPMRDIDLLVREADLDRAQALLLELGFQPSPAHEQMPEEHHHMQPVIKKIDGLHVSVELHRDLLPASPRHQPWPLEKSWTVAKPMEIGGRLARILAPEQALLHGCLHNFQAPLNYEPFRLIHAADMVTLAERHLAGLDWENIRKETPVLLNAVSRLHFLSPLPPELISRLKLDLSAEPKGAGLGYAGWTGDITRKDLLALPLRLLRQPQLALDTLLPPQWWTQLYYGCADGLPYWRARLVEHPRALLYLLSAWIRAYQKERRLLRAA